ncbi:Do family serine endopeptidase [Olivibacter sp. SDN3]|uniref:S1C family serine protease n=1 Tax=Olivibacter sp. SDN3 TaxID=2764720 RepID=UPI001650F390|nr:Do family serine endopeptidase [Olivibacter sp. SDN3]QNL51215.1 Do family serine endopeptidase [Olivibacter sp. SDN3]
MKKIGLTLLTALIGGAVAVGGYKLLEKKQGNQLSFEERQQIHYANNPSDISASTGNLDFTQAAAAVSPAVVHIKTTYERSGNQRGSDPFQDMFEEFFGAPRGRQRQQQQPQRASGSGVIISADGYIVTNNHVVENADKIAVELTNKKVYDAKVIGRDPNTDLALIKVNATGLPIVKLGNSDEVNIGEWVLAVGYPMGLQSTVTAGIVSAKGRAIGILADQQRQEQYQRWQQEGADPDNLPASSAVESFIQTDAVINRGNSGGALVNANGELVGINAAIMSQSGYYAGYGFAIPVNLVKKIADDFVKFGSVKRGYVGVTFQELDTDVAKQLGVDEINGLYVNSVIPGGGGAAAGLKKGDIITKIDGNVIYSSPDLQERVARLRPGDKVKLTYKRDGKEKDVTVTLKGEEENKSEKESESEKRSTAELYNKLGAGFIPATDAQKKQHKINSGVVVSEVRRGGLFDMYDVPRGLIITAINGRAVSNVDEVESALGNNKNNLLQLNGITPDGARVDLRFPLQ